MFTSSLFPLLKIAENRIVARCEWNRCMNVKSKDRFAWIVNGTSKKYFFSSRIFSRKNSFRSIRSFISCAPSVAIGFCTVPFSMLLLPVTSLIKASFTLLSQPVCITDRYEHIVYMKIIHTKKQIEMCLMTWKPLLNGQNCISIRLFFIHFTHKYVNYKHIRSELKEFTAINNNNF